MRLVVVQIVVFGLIVIELVAELVQVVAEQVVDLNSDLFDFLPFFFYSRN
jgi:hypothetical protein